MTSNNEIVMNLDEQYLIETNEKVLLREQEKTGKEVYIETVPKNLARVFPKVSEYGNSGNKEQDLIEKAAAIIATPAWTQAFFDGNRRTGIVAADKFLRGNGYRLMTDPEGENAELRGMLKGIKKHQRDLDPNIMKQLILYTSERIRKYESRR